MTNTTPAETGLDERIAAIEAELRDFQQRRIPTSVFDDDPHPYLEAFIASDDIDFLLTALRDARAERDHRALDTRCECGIADVCALVKECIVLERQVADLTAEIAALKAVSGAARLSEREQWIQETFDVMAADPDPLSALYDGLAKGNDHD